MREAYFGALMLPYQTARKSGDTSAHPGFEHLVRRCTPDAGQTMHNLMHRVCLREGLHKLILCMHTLIMSFVVPAPAGAVH